MPYEVGSWQHKLLLILDDWCDAINDGSAFTRMPDPNYVRRNGDPTWTDADLRELFTRIDNYVWLQATLWTPIKGEYDIGPDYGKLPALQLLALAQDLDKLLSSVPSEDIAAVGYGSADVYVPAFDNPLNANPSPPPADEYYLC